MSRTKGSKNKPKNNTNIKVISFERQIEGAPINKNTSLGWVNWGEENSYPDLLLGLYNQSPTHHSAIDFGVCSIIGDGVDYDAMQIDGSQIVPNYKESWDDLIKSIALDYMLFGSFAIEIIKNNDNLTYSFWHIPLHKVRWSEYDEDGQILGYYICSDWTKTSSNPPLFVKAFDMQEEIEKSEPYLYVYRKYDPTLEYYTSPHYIAGIQAIQSEVEHILFDLKTTTNSFVPSGMLVLPEMEREEDKSVILREIGKMFQGSQNANAIMTVFRGNVDENKPEFIPFVANTSNVNLFEASNLRTQARILAAHKIPDAALCGLPSIGNNGFTSEAAKLETAFKIYQKLTGNSNRNTIIKSINFMLSMNGVETELILKPFSLDIDENEKVDDKMNQNENNDSEEKVEDYTNVDK